MRTRLLLIRHGQSEWNAQNRWQGRSDTPLNDTGREQARRLAAHLRERGETPAAIYASPLQRAGETAALIGAAFDLAPATEPGLIEYDVGAFEGLTPTEVAERFPDVWTRWQTSPEWTAIPGAEDRPAFCERVHRTFEDIVARHTGQTVAIVSHGGTLGAYLLCALGLDPKRHSPFLFANGSLTIFDHDPFRPRIVMLNYQC
jgi:broad specificity phosphatase PhoE